MLRSLLLFFALFGIHTKLRLILPGEAVIPDIITIAIGLLFVLIHFPKYFREKLFYYYLLILFFFCSIFWGPSSFNSYILTQKFLAFFQIFSALIIGYAIFNELKKHSNNFLFSLFLYYFIFLLLGTVIEVFTPLKYTFEFMSNFYREGSYYSIETTSSRDIAYYLYIRPKFLTLEPSYLGETFTMLNLFIRLLNTRKGKNVHSILLFLGSFFLVRSPAMLVFFPILFLINLFEKPTINKVSLSNLFVFLFSIIAISLSIYLISGRIETAMYGLDKSLIFRILGPLYITFDVLTKYPLLGVGVGAQEVIMNEMINQFASFGLKDFIISDDNLLKQNHSSVLRFLTYFGIVGFSTLIYLLHKLMQSLNVKHPGLILSIFFFLGFTNGHFGISTWTYFFICCRITQNE